MNKSDLIKTVSQETGMPVKDVTKVVDNFLIAISEGLKTDDVAIKDFGTFKKVTQKARVARNPSTNAVVYVPEKEVVKLKTSKNILNIKWL